MREKESLGVWELRRQRQLDFLFAQGHVDTVPRRLGIKLRATKMVEEAKYKNSPGWGSRTRTPSVQSQREAGLQLLRSQLQLCGLQDLSFWTGAYAPCRMKASVPWLSS